MPTRPRHPPSATFTLPSWPIRPAATLAVAAAVAGSQSAQVRTPSRLFRGAVAAASPGAMRIHPFPLRAHPRPRQRLQPQPPSQIFAARRSESRSAILVDPHLHHYHASRSSPVHLSSLAPSPSLHASAASLTHLPQTLTPIPPASALRVRVAPPRAAALHQGRPHRASPPRPVRRTTSRPDAHDRYVVAPVIPPSRILSPGHLRLPQPHKHCRRGSRAGRILQTPEPRV